MSPPCAVFFPMVRQLWVTDWVSRGSVSSFLLRQKCILALLLSLCCKGWAKMKGRLCDHIKHHDLLWSVQYLFQCYYTSRFHHAEDVACVKFCWPVARERCRGSLNVYRRCLEAALHSHLGRKRVCFLFYLIVSWTFQFIFFNGVRLFLGRPFIMEASGMQRS